MAISLVCVLVPAREISSGQRLFSIIETGDTFKQLNTQGETNLHNLKINGVSINKLIFGKLLSCYISLSFSTPICSKKNGFNRSSDKAFGVPIATNFQIIFCLIIFGLCEISGSSKKGELFEFGATCIFMLIFLFREIRKS